jgi:HKD family nuclease
VSAIDTSGISLFKELKATLEKKGVEVRIFNSEIYFDLFTIDMS